MTKRPFTIELPTDGNGLVGRQCTKNDCSEYFKIKPGTGLSKPTQAYCPYCGHTDDPSDFLTGEQKEYMLSVVRAACTHSKRPRRGCWPQSPADKSGG